MIKVISFDLDGTISNDTFDKILWNKELPKLVAQRHQLSFDEAEKHVFAEFYRALFIERIDNFTDVAYWFERHGLTDWEALLCDMKQHFFIYPDAQEIIEYLHPKYELVILSSSERTMIEIKLEDNPITSYFTKILSTPSDFKIPMKNKTALKNLLDLLQIEAHEIVHVGDSKHMDYENAMAVGIQAYYLDRSGKESGEHVIHLLTQLKTVL